MTLQHVAWFCCRQRLRHAHESSCDWDVNTTANAAQNGHLDCLRYAREHGCDWDRQTPHAAALHGYLDCLHYAREHGRPWNERTIRGAYLGCLRYAQQHGCPWERGLCFDLFDGCSMVVPDCRKCQRFKRGTLRLLLPALPSDLIALICKY